MADQKQVAKALIRKLINSKEIERLFYLKDRWADEHEYEDFKEYETDMNDRICKPHGVEMIKATQRPFGFKLKLKGMTRPVHVGVYRKGKYDVIKAKNA